MTPRIALLLATLALAGCAREFPELPYSPEDAAFRDTLAAAEDFDSRLALGRLLFEHNQIDAAHDTLAALVAAAPDHPEAVAWHAANDCKRAARGQPWLLGLRKLYLLNDCLKRIDDAAGQAPEDLTVQLVAVNTGAAVNLFGSLERARTITDRLMAAAEATDNPYPPGAVSHILLGAAAVATAEGDATAARALLERVIALAADPAAIAAAHSQITAGP